MKSQTTATPKLFIGMDIHKKSWSVHMRTDLFDHKGFSMPPEADKLVDYVQAHFADHVNANFYVSDFIFTDFELSAKEKSRLKIWSQRDCIVRIFFLSTYKFVWKVAIKVKLQSVFLF